MALCGRCHRGTRPAHCRTAPMSAPDELISGLFSQIDSRPPPELFVSVFVPVVCDFCTERRCVKTPGQNRPGCGAPQADRQKRSMP